MPGLEGQLREEVEARELEKKRADELQAQQDREAAQNELVSGDSRTAPDWTCRTRSRFWYCSSLLLCLRLGGCARQVVYAGCAGGCGVSGVVAVVVVSGWFVVGIVPGSGVVALNVCAWKVLRIFRHHGKAVLGTASSWC